MVVGVFFGGKSCEHDISIITGMQTIKGLAAEHKAIPVYIDEQGAWWTGKHLAEIETFRRLPGGKRKIEGKRVHIRPASNWLYSESGKKLNKLDVCILANHGLNGEDGTLQGALELSGLPYTGADVRGSSIGMDKIIMKQVFEGNGLPVLPYIYFDIFEYNSDLYAIVERIKKKLTFPLMVKPSNLGSSIGISKTKNWEELFTAIRLALEWDTRVIIENALVGFTELNCACVRIGDESILSQIEKPIGWQEFLTFEDKYMTKSLGEGREFPAKITLEQSAQVRELTIAACRAVGTNGVARVDFLMDGETLYVNEINTIPGAMSSYLYEYEGGLTFTKLLDKCMDAGIKRNLLAKKLKYSYKAPLSLKMKK